MIAVSEARLRADIETNAQFGAIDTDDGWGRTVLTGTGANREARDRLVDRLEDAGLAVTVDRVGNVVGRWVPDTADPDAAPVAAGSHLDSVPRGGVFDGPLGVYAAVESVRALQRSSVEPSRPVHVVCFTEEEGQRFSNGLLGSSVATGRMDVAEALALTDDDGTTCAESLDRIGYHGSGRVDASEWEAWVELHIEQGTRLEDAGAQAGIVTDIAGITHCYVDVAGHADHAGSTPMNDRTDAIAAASELVLELETEANRIASETSSTAVGTVGKLDASPNATNVIAGDATLGVDVRDVNRASIESLVDTLEASANRIATDRGVDVDVRRPYMVPPEPMADRCQSAFRAAAENANVPTLSLHSGAAHDTMNVARVTDAGLLFAVSNDGVSHNPLERTTWEDCRAATAVLAGAIAELAT